MHGAGRRKTRFLALAHTPHLLIIKMFLNPQGPIVLCGHLSENCTLAHIADLSHVSVVLYLCPMYHNQIKESHIHRPSWLQSAASPTMPQGISSGLLPTKWLLVRKGGKVVRPALWTAVHPGLSRHKQKPNPKEHQADSPLVFKHLQRKDKQSSLDVCQRQAEDNDGSLVRTS